MKDLAGFVLARLHEDRDAAAAAMLGMSLSPIACCDPSRVLREIHAKRERLDRYLDQPGYDLPDGVHDGRDPAERLRDDAVRYALEYEVREDAAVWSGHPDYKQHWKPV
jgi:Family of unknown function (DUF6221)